MGVGRSAINLAMFAAAALPAAPAAATTTGSGEQQAGADVDRQRLPALENLRRAHGIDRNDAGWMTFLGDLTNPTGEANSFVHRGETWQDYIRRARSNPYSRFVLTGDGETVYLFGEEGEAGPEREALEVIYGLHEITSANMTVETFQTLLDASSLFYQHGRTYWFCRDEYAVSVSARRAVELCAQAAEAGGYDDGVGGYAAERVTASRYATGLVGFGRSMRRVPRDCRRAADWLRIARERKVEADAEHERFMQELREEDPEEYREWRELMDEGLRDEETYTTAEAFDDIADSIERCWSQEGRR